MGLFLECESETASFHLFTICAVRSAGSGAGRSTRASVVTALLPDCGRGGHGVRPLGRRRFRHDSTSVPLFARKIKFRRILLQGTMKQIFYRAFSRNTRRIFAYKPQIRIMRRMRIFIEAIQVIGDCAKTRLFA